MDAQNVYIRALEEFKAVSQQNPKALEFSARDLPASPKRVLFDEGDRVILEN